MGEIVTRSLQCAVVVVLVIGAILCGEASAESADLLRVVAQLDTMKHPWAPVVEISKLGPQVIPYVIERLASPNYGTALSAVWVFRYMASEESYLPLLEAWAAAKRTPGGASRYEAAALEATLQERWASSRSLVSRHVDDDLHAIVDQIVCRNEYRSSDIVVFGEDLSPAYKFDCVPAPRVAWAGSPNCLICDGPEGPYVRISAQIHDLTDSGCPMPAWEALMGGRPEVLAVVSVMYGWIGGPHHHGEGYTAPWVRSGGRWTELEHTSEVME